MWETATLLTNYAQVRSGSHLESCRMVAEGEADVAGIDCVTLEHIRLDGQSIKDGGGGKRGGGKFPHFFS